MEQFVVVLFALMREKDAAGLANNVHLIRPRVYKKNFMLNSAAHEIVGF